MQALVGPGIPAQTRTSGTSRSLTEVIESAGQVLHRTGRLGAVPSPTGFSPLDTHLGGGLRAGELAVVAGMQGLGKTTFTLQMARNVVAAGGSALYACFEHDEHALLERLLVLEAGLVARADAPTLTQVRRRLTEGTNLDLVALLADLPGMLDALERLMSYGSRMQLLRARGDTTSVAQLAVAVRELSPARPVLFVDYLQKVADDQGLDEETHVSRVARGLKDLALDLEVPVVAIAAMERQGADVRRMRLRHLKGSVTVAYEADVVLVLNAKDQIVARDHLMFGTDNLERFREQVVCSVEKNRSGETGVDMEFHKELAFGRFDARGALVAEHLVDDRVHVE